MRINAIPSLREGESDLIRFLSSGAEMKIPILEPYPLSLYARFVGKRLPTIFHWTGVALTQASVKVAPASNFGGRGPEPVGTGRGLTNYGVYDMAGNVKA